MAPGSDERPFHVRGFLAEIAAHAEMRDKAFDQAENPPEAWLLSANLGQRAYGAQDALDALILTALEHPDPPTHEELADAGGMTMEQIAELQARLDAASAPPAEKRSRFRLRGRRD